MGDLKSHLTHNVLSGQCHDVLFDIRLEKFTSCISQAAHRKKI